MIEVAMFTDVALRPPNRLKNREQHKTKAQSKTTDKRVAMYALLERTQYTAFWESAQTLVVVCHHYNFI